MEANFTYAAVRVKNLDESPRLHTILLGMKAPGRNRIEASDEVVASLLDEY